MSEPIPVTTRIITAESGSSRSVKATLKSPDENQVKTRSAIARASGSLPPSCHTAAQEIRNDASIAPHAARPATALLTRRPRLAFSRKPTNGRSGIKSSMGPSDDIRSPFEARERVGIQRLAGPEQADHDRQAHGRLGRRDGHDEEHDDLSIRGAQGPAERDECEVDRVEHDLDGQENRNEIAAHEDAGSADRKEDRRQQQVVAGGRHQRCSPRRARTTAPTIATRMSTEVTSNANA